jgi:hypothetical protein
LQKAIDQAFEAGGGAVSVPPGIFLTGGLVLRSRVTLYLQAGAVLRGSTDVNDYEYHAGPPQEGDANGRHLIFARDAEDIAIVGQGTIDGQGSAFWHRKGRSRPKLEEMWGDVIAWDYEPATQRRPSPMLEFAYCKNVRVEGITLTNAAGWTMRPIACESVYIRGVRVRNPIFAPNTDGMDLTACRNVFVSDCDIATGDDAICIKSENSYGELLPTKNITVTNCVLSTCCNGFKIGTATHGAVENIVFSNSVIYNDDATPLNERVTSGIALEVVDGGTLNGVTISNIRMQNARTPIFIRLGKRTLGAASYLRNVMISGVNATGAIITSSITGVPGMPVEDITLADISIATSEHGRPEWTRHSVPEQAANYPEARMFGRLSASSLYVRHVNRLRLCNLRLKAEAPDVRPAVVCDDVHDLGISGLRATAPAERGNPSLLYTSPAMSLCMAPKRQRTRRHLCRCPERVLRESCCWATISRMLHSQSSSRMVPSQPLSHLDPEQQFHNPLCFIELGENQAYAKYPTHSYVSCPHVVLRLCCCLRADRAAFAAG